MAKISARGATKLAEVRVTTEGTDTETVFVICSDGRVLRRWVGLSGYSVYGRIKDPSKRTREFLVAQLVRHGYEVKS